MLLYGCTTRTLTKSIKKKLDGNCTRMLRITLNKSWKQYLTKQQLYGQLPPSLKPSELDEQDIRESAGEARTISLKTFFHGPLIMDVSVLVNLQELTYNGSTQMFGRPAWGNGWQGRMESQGNPCWQRDLMLMTITLYEITCPITSPALYIWGLRWTEKNVHGKEIHWDRWTSVRTMKKTYSCSPMVQETWFQFQVASYFKNGTLYLLA